MLLTCRSTVRSLSTSSAAIALLVSPAATSAQHLELALGEPVGIARRVARASESSRARSGAAPSSCERRPRRLQLQRGRVLVAQRAAGEPDELAHAGRLVGRLELLPHLPRAAKRDQRGSRASPSASSTAPAPARPSRRARPSRDPRRSTPSSRQAPRAASRSPDGEHDLDVGRQQPRALARLGGLGHRPADRGRRGVVGFPGPAAAGQGPAAARARAGSPPGRPPRPRRSRRAGGGSRPAGSRPRRPPPGSPPAQQRSAARRASSSASGQAPCSCMISARCTRQRPVKATRSGWRSHQPDRAAVHSWARRTSWASWQARITPQ